MSQPTTPQRCKICKKILRLQNQSKLCSHHLRCKNQKLLLQKRREKFCNKCGVACSGKLLIELRKNYYYGFCYSCFEKIRLLPIKEIRKIVFYDK